MTTRVKVAAVQAAPVFLQREATIDRDPRPPVTFSPAGDGAG